jgi:uncharacterized protein (TIGR02145 family)
LGGNSLSVGKMKETGTNYWLFPNKEATNSSGFTGLPGGQRWWSNGTFSYINSQGGWWSSSDANNTFAFIRYLTYDNGNTGSYVDYKLDGFSVRCLKD